MDGSLLSFVLLGGLDGWDGDDFCSCKKQSRALLGYGSEARYELNMQSAAYRQADKPPISAAKDPTTEKSDSI